MKRGPLYRFGVESSCRIKSWFFSHILGKG